MAMYTSKGRYYLTADRSKVVPEGDPAAAFLYATAGREVDADEAKALGLLELDKGAAKEAAQAEPEAAADAEPEPATKAVHEPPEDKAVPAPRRGH